MMSFIALTFSNSERFRTLNFSNLVKRNKRILTETFRALIFSKYNNSRIIKLFKYDTFKTLKPSNLAIKSSKNFRVRFPSKSGEF